MYYNTHPVPLIRYMFNLFIDLYIQYNLKSYISYLHEFMCLAVVSVNDDRVVRGFESHCRQEFSFCSFHLLRVFTDRLSPHK